jgi:5-methylcytosine-specific restriction endonuclease McrBC regulatory subunit McrC
MPLKAYLMSLSFAFQEEEKEKAWGIYLTLYPHMVLKEIKHIPFSEFFQQSILEQPYIAPISTEDILEDAKRIAEKAGEPFGNI